MSRKKIVIDMDVMREEIERHDPQVNRSALFKKVAQSYNERTGDGIDHQLVGLRIKEYEIPITTPLGKRGRQKKV